MNIEKIRKALRINGTHLDDQLEELVKTARCELVRSGCAEEIVNDDTNSLVNLAIVTFVKAQMEEDPTMSARYSESFMAQEDAIRRSKNV